MDGNGTEIAKKPLFAVPLLAPPLPHFFAPLAPPLNSPSFSGYGPLDMGHTLSELQLFENSDVGPLATLAVMPAPAYIYSYSAQ